MRSITFEASSDGLPGRFVEKSSHIISYNIHTCIKYIYIYILNIIMIYYHITENLLSHLSEKLFSCFHYRSQVVNLFNRSKRTKQLVCSARTRPWRHRWNRWRLVKREVEGLRWFRPGGASRRTSEGQVDTFRVRDHSKFWALGYLWQLGPSCFIFTPQKPDRHNSWRKRIRSSSKRQGDTECAHEMQQILIQSHSIPLYIPYHTL